MKSEFAYEIMVKFMNLKWICSLLTASPLAKAAVLLLLGRDREVLLQ